jgi:type IV pilus assembly protein PilW
MSVDNLKQAMQPNAERIMPVNKLLRQHQGFTLIEIMVSMLLGIFLLGGVMGIFLNTKQTYRVQDALGRLQENGRYAMDFIGKGIRMTDYRGCPTTPPSLLLPNTPITGTEGAHAANRAKDSPDSITVRWSLNGCAAHTAPLDPDGCPLLNGCPVGLNGCPIDTNKECALNSGFTINTATKILNQNAASLIEGVENMQIQYGVDTDPTNPDGAGVPNYYTDFSAGLDMSQVVSVRVSLLLATIDDNVTANPLPYTFNGARDDAPGDRRIRRVFSSTFALRNRIH